MVIEPANIISLNMIYFIPHEFLFWVVIPGLVDKAVSEKNIINLRLETASQGSCYSSRENIRWHKLSIRNIEIFRPDGKLKRQFFFQSALCQRHADKCAPTKPRKSRIHNNKERSHFTHGNFFIDKSVIFLKQRSFS